MKRFLLATVALTAFAASNAIAADIPARMPTKAPAYVAMYNWTGGYIGLNAGVGFTDSLSGDNDTGFIGGAQIGYNWQGAGSPWVFGLEADFQGSTQGASATVAGITASADLNYFGTVRARLGYAWDRVMVYATGGLAYQNVDLTVTGPGFSLGGDSTELGWTLGGGVEWALWDRWTMKAEYLYVRTDDHTVTVPLVGTVGGDVENHVVRLGVNYRF